jgi:predicted DNA-binding transcriptional regulator AlpA
MSNTKRKMPADNSAVFYVEQQIDDWIRAQINGNPWQPVEPAKPVLIRRREVLRRVGFSNFKRWRLESDGRFPRGHRIGEMMNGKCEARPHPRLIRRAPVPVPEAAE